MGDDYHNPSVEADPRVCADCFGDDGLKDFVRGHADARQCSFCGATGSDDIAAPLGEVIDHMLACLARDYNDPDNAGMVYESAEGGYQGRVWDTYDFVQNELALELPNDDDNSLFNAICNGLGSQLWCTRHLYSLGPDRALAYSWETFCKLVKHESGPLSAALSSSRTRFNHHAMPRGYRRKLVHARIACGGGGVKFCKHMIEAAPDAELFRFNMSKSL
jgi:hypothetical protein